jgi:hypothetical protein
MAANKDAGHKHTLIPMKDKMAKSTAAAKKSGKTFLGAWQSGTQACSTPSCNYTKAPKSTK